VVVGVERKVQSTMNYFRFLSLKRIATVIILITAVWFLSEFDVAFNRTDGIDTPTANTPDQWEEPQDLLSKSDDGAGNVTLTAQYIPNESSPEQVVFEVFLNSHSVDLESVDFLTDIYLENGQKTSLPISVTESGSGHHRSAVIVFPQQELPFNLVAKNVAGIDKRTLTWDSF